ncbi:glycosyltransferase family 9 protein [Celerinatantimonas sp. YJH-8]|uniref:glycosyltransferase family 9 protein n=1 Tax=Celerinatantimonas sp. YJH-8 TaxID=3228714 RepID=UPI0038C56ADF
MGRWIRFKNFLRQCDKTRRRSTRRFEILIYWLLGHINPATELQWPPSEIHSILVLRNNKRLGNITFLIPFLHDLIQRYPKAQIELIIPLPWQQQIIDHFGIEVHISQISFRHLWKTLRLIYQLKHRTYDMIIMPFSSSTDAILAALLRSRYKIAFYHPYRHFIFNHNIETQQRALHSAYSALALWDKNLLKGNYRLKFSPTEQQRIQKLQCQLHSTHQYRIGFFRGARGEKVISDPTWKLLIEHVNQKIPTIQWIEILHPGEKTAPLAVKGLQTIKTYCIRELAMQMAAFDLFISGDTGPLHLADAADAFCLGLFTQTDPCIYGCIGEHGFNLDLRQGIDEQRISQIVISWLTLHSHHVA